MSKSLLLTPIRDLSKLRRANDALLDGVSQEARDRHLAEIYVLAEADWLRTQPTVAKAIAERGLQIHAFVFDKSKEATVRLIENPETETEIRSTKSSSAKVNGEEPKCTGSCGGLGLCKNKEKQEENKKYAF